MKFLGGNFGIWFPSALLIAGLISDLLYRKYHNVHFLIALALTVILVLTFFGVQGLLGGLTGGLVALGIGVFLTLTGVIGAGDMKLMLVFGFATNYEAVLLVYLYAFIWGALLGLSQVILSGEFKDLMKNMRVLAFYRLKPEQKSLHMIPFTVPLFLGWVSHLTLEQLRPGGIL